MSYAKGPSVKWKTKKARKSKTKKRWKKVGNKSLKKAIDFNNLMK